MTDMAKSLFVTWAALACLVLFSCADPDKEKANQLLEQAQELHRKGQGDSRDRRQQMMGLLKQAINLAPELHQARNAYALLLIEEGDFSAALKQAYNMPFQDSRRARISALASAGLFQVKRDSVLVDEVIEAVGSAGPDLAREDRYTIARKLCRKPRGTAETPVDFKALEAGIDLLRELTAEQDVPGNYHAYLGLALLQLGGKREVKEEIVRVWEKALQDPNLEQREMITKVLASLKEQLKQKE